MLESDLRRTLQNGVSGSKRTQIAPIFEQFSKPIPWVQVSIRSLHWVGLYEEFGDRHGSKRVRCPADFDSILSHFGAKLIKYLGRLQDLWGFSRGLAEITRKW